MGVEFASCGSSVRFEVHPATKWTIEVLTGAIVALRESGYPVNSGFLEAQHKNLYEAINRFPGGWKKIIELAGCDPSQESRRHIRGWRDARAVNS